MGKLSAKQEAFCIEYVIDLNATQAAIRSGYSEKTAYSAGQRLLKHVEVMKRLADYAKKKCDKADIDADTVITGIRNIADAEDSSYRDKLKAFELLGKYLKLFVDKVEMKHEGEIKVFGVADIRPHKKDNA